MPAPRHGREFWEPIVAELEASEQTQEEFARQHRLNVGSLRSWLYRLRREHGGQVRLLAVRVKGSQRDDHGSLLELGIGDVVVRFAAGTDVQYILDLISRLRDRC